MLRNLIIVAAVIIVILVLRQRLRNGSPSAIPGVRRKAASKPSMNMVQCQLCNTYVPASEAIDDGGQHFCCMQHKRDWDRQNRSG